MCTLREILIAFFFIHGKSLLASIISSRLCITVRVAYYEHIGDREIMFIIKELHIMQTSLSSLIVN